MNFRNRMERNILFLDTKIDKMEKILSRYKQLRFQYQGMLISDDKYFTQLLKEHKLKVSHVKLGRRELK